MTTPNRYERTNDNISSLAVYAGVADFRDSFLANMNRMYLLAYLLTGDHEMAERCFVMGFDQCIDGSAVFKGWVQRWTRKAIIKNAILLIPSESEEDRGRFNEDHHQGICLREKDAHARECRPVEAFRALRVCHVCTRTNLRLRMLPALELHPRRSRSGKAKCDSTSRSSRFSVGLAVGGWIDSYTPMPNLKEYS